MAGAARAGYQVGRDNPDMFGGGGGQPAWGSQNGDGGEEANGASEFATKDDLAQHAQGINDRLDSIQAGLQNAGGVQDRNSAMAQGMGTAPTRQASGTQRPNAPSALTADHASQARALQQRMADAHASIQGIKERATAQFAARQAQGVSMAPQLSGNAMSSTQGSNTMNGLVRAGMSAAWGCLKTHSTRRNGHSR